MKKLLLLIFLFISLICSAQVNIAVVGESYRDEATFKSDWKQIADEMAVRLPSQRVFNVVLLSWKNKFQCKESGIFDGGECNWSKVSAEVNSFHLPFTPTTTVVLSKTLHGGSGLSVCMVGTERGDSCTGNTGVHEVLGHSICGLPFDPHKGLFMQSGTSQGCGSYNVTFDRYEDSIIAKRLDELAGKIIDTTPPVLTINTPVNNGVYPAGQQVILTATTSKDVRWVEVIYDTGIRFYAPFWDRNVYFNYKQGIRVFSYPPVGSRWFTINVTDAGGNKISKTVNFTVN